MLNDVPLLRRPGPSTNVSPGFRLRLPSAANLSSAALVGQFPNLAYPRVSMRMWMAGGSGRGMLSGERVGSAISGVGMLVWKDVMRATFFWSPDVGSRRIKVRV